MTMNDWINELDNQIIQNKRKVLEGKGKHKKHYLQHIHAFSSSVLLYEKICKLSRI